MGKARGGKGLSIARGATVRWDTGPAAIRQYPYRTACGPAGEEAQPGPGACYATYSSSTGSRESSRAFQFTDEDGLGGLGGAWNRVRTCSRRCSLGVARWCMSSCSLQLCSNCSSFDFFNSKFDHSFYSKIYAKYHFICCGLLYQYKIFKNNLNLAMLAHILFWKRRAVKF